MVLPPEAAAALRPLRDRLRGAAVFCDVDGTLAPIRPRPEDVVLAADLRARLAALRDRVALLAFVSGRALADVEALVGLDGCAYAGNHGLEIREAGGGRHVAAAAAPFLPAVAAFAGAWPEGALAPHGVRLEDKGATLSFHYRTAPDPDAARAFLEGTVATAAAAAGLRATPGRMVLEVRPPSQVDKGTAVRDLIAASGARAAVYLGDDHTDVDAWRALGELHADGALDVALAVGVVEAETPAAVRGAADVLVDGPAGAAAVIAALLA